MRQQLQQLMHIPSENSANSTPHRRPQLNHVGVSAKLGYLNFGVLIIRILLFRILYLGPLFSETPMYMRLQVFSFEPGDPRMLWSSVFGTTFC